MTAGAETGLVGNRNPNVYGSMGNSFKSNTYYLPDLTDQYWRWDGFLTKDGWQGEGQDLTGNFLRL
jgi:hypothetical protein